jgi:Ca-activated chloride channel family protein
MNDWLPVALRASGWLLLLPLPWLLWRFRGLGELSAAFPRRRESGNPGDSRTDQDRVPAAAGMTKNNFEKRLTKFADAHLLERLIVGPARVAGAPLARLAWLLIVIAASGPYLPQASEGARRVGMDVAVVIDISPSMVADDVEPTRLKRAALELQDFLRRLGDDRAALIVYSAYAYRILPLTHDLDLLNHYAAALAPDLTRRHGSNLAQALEYAGQALGDDRSRGRAVVVLSDGETDDRAGALAAADRLKARGISIYALGIGTDAGAPVPGASGFLRTADGLVISRLDRALLTAIAQQTGGAYADARADDRDWDKLLPGLDSLRRSTVPPPQARTGYALHPWLLAAAFALLLWSGMRRPRVAAVPLGLVLIVTGSLLPPAGHAAPWQERAAYDALTQGDNTVAAMRYQSLDSYNGWLGRGAAYYRQQHWEPALAAFTHAIERAGDDGERATALYNQGTTLARLGRYAEAQRALEQALQLQPNHARAQLNLNLVKHTGTPPPPVPESGMARQRDSAESITTSPDVTNRNADAGGDGAASISGNPAAAGAAAAPEEQLARSLGNLAALRDRPEEILLHRFLVQDSEHPLVTEEQSW